MLKDFQFVDFIIIDTENKKGFMKIDLALRIAQWLGGRYFLMEKIKSENLIGIINSSSMF